ncbi:hypothetical protein [Thiomicrorhabdus cannonii]|uniref:hypothetical protein n=1 Tax=Thiomicrorhabdus cannonii TaxID=2748011 RepID=UPI0015BC401F|nr:hypothetical protein [Thiomicrorhabdus cannonii]
MIKQGSEFYRDQTLLLENIKHYEFINSQGRLDLEYFCVMLSTCFIYDDVKQAKIPPEKIHGLLIKLLKNSSSDEEELNLWIRHQTLIDWTPNMAHIYPEGSRTFIHVAGLVKVMESWVSGIGHTILKIPKPINGGMYYAWVKPEWVLVKAFIQTFHDKFWTFIKAADRKMAEEYGYSHFEVLHKSTREGKGFDKAKAELETKALAYKRGAHKIEQAMAAGFFLEAISLQESLISHCLFNYLKAKKIDARNLNFAKLIQTSKECIGKQGEVVELLNSLDDWRLARNKAIHGFTESAIEDENNDLKFFESSKTTASEGKALFEQVYKWYLDESLNFVDTQFKTSKEGLH